MKCQRVEEFKNNRQHNLSPYNKWAAIAPSIPKPTPKAAAWPEDEAELEAPAELPEEVALALEERLLEPLVELL